MILKDVTEYIDEHLREFLFRSSIIVKGGIRHESHNVDLMKNDASIISYAVLCTLCGYSLLYLAHYGKIGNLTIDLTINLLLLVAVKWLAMSVMCYYIFRIGGGGGTLKGTVAIYVQTSAFVYLVAGFVVFFSYLIFGERALVVYPEEQDIIIEGTIYTLKYTQVVFLAFTFVAMMLLLARVMSAYHGVGIIRSVSFTAAVIAVSSTIQISYWLLAQKTSSTDYPRNFRSGDAPGVAVTLCAFASARGPGRSCPRMGSPQARGAACAGAGWRGMVGAARSS